MTDTTSSRGPVRPLEIIGGHSALDLANTVDDPHGPHRWDHIATWPALSGWLEDAGVVTPAERDMLDHSATSHPAAAQGTVQRAAQLRHAVVTLFTAVVTRAPTDDGWLLLRPFLAEAAIHADLAGTQPMWGVSQGLDAPLWRIADAAHLLLRGAQLDRVKRCDNCPWLFLDTSRNRSRRWCSMADCGSHVKVQRGTQRRRDLRATQPD